VIRLIGLQLDRVPLDEKVSFFQCPGNDCQIRLLIIIGNDNDAFLWTFKFNNPCRLVENSPYPRPIASRIATGDLELDHLFRRHGALVPKDHD
jgi:hypothetical protein